MYTLRKHFVHVLNRLAHPQDNKDVMATPETLSRLVQLEPPIAALKHPQREQTRGSKGGSVQ